MKLAFQGKSRTLRSPWEKGYDHHAIASVNNREVRESLDEGVVLSARFDFAAFEEQILQNLCLTLNLLLEIGEFYGVLRAR